MPKEHRIINVLFKMSNFHCNPLLQPSRVNLIGTLPISNHTNANDWTLHKTKKLTPTLVLLHGYSGAKLVAVIGCSDACFKLGVSS